MVTGRHRAQRRRLAEAVRRQAHPASGEVRRHRQVTRAVHAQGGAHLPADPARRPLRLPPAVGGAVAHQVADQSVHAARAVGARRRAQIARLRAPLRGWRARPATTASRSMGSEGYLLNQFIAPRTNQRNDALGRRCARKRMRFAVEIVRRMREAVRPRLHHHLPAVAARPGRGRQQLGRDRRAGQGDRGRRRHASSTPASAGTRRACRPSPPRCRAPRSPASPRKLKPRRVDCR